MASSDLSNTIESTMPPPLEVDSPGLEVESTPVDTNPTQLDADSTSLDISSALLDAYSTALEVPASNISETPAFEPASAISDASSSAYSALSSIPENLSTCSEAIAKTRVAEPTVADIGLEDVPEEPEHMTYSSQEEEHASQSSQEEEHGSQSSQEEESSKPPEVAGKERVKKSLYEEFQELQKQASQTGYTSIADGLRSRKASLEDSSPRDVPKRSTRRSRRNAAPPPPLTLTAQPTQTAELSTPRRSQRARHAPPKFEPSPSTPVRRSAKPKTPTSLLVKLPISPEALNGLKNNSPPAQLPSPQSLKKRKDKPLDSNSEERPTARRRSSKIAFTLPIQKGVPPTHSQVDNVSQFAHPALVQFVESRKSPCEGRPAVCAQASAVGKGMPMLPALPPWNAPSPPTSSADSDTSEATTIIDPQVSVELQEISEQLMASSNVKSKPEPSAQPEVWADTRMELCETLHYYRSYHGGCYATGGFARAFMFADSAHPRDFMDASVIISRAGGGLAKDQDTGKMKMSKDQAENSIVQSLRNSMAQWNPVVIITANNNPYVPSAPPHPYCVLDYFKPSNIWWEKSQGKKFLRYRFEKLNAKKACWWQPKGTTEVAEPGSLDPPIVHTCTACSHQSQQVYLQGWMCLQPNCTSFWKVHSLSGQLQEPNEESLISDPRFLKQSTPWPNDNHQYPLASVDVELSGRSIAGEDCLRAHWSGVVCPQCGRCNSRLAWTGWKCANPGCTFEKRPPHALMPAASLHDAFNPVSDTYTQSRDLHSSSIKLSVSFAHNYRINRFAIPGVNGIITHLIANKTVIEEAGGPNDMYEELQQTDIGLARRPMGRDHFTRHYAVNYGMPYKFIAATASSPFTGSARPITATRSRLNWAAKHLLSTETGKSMETLNKEWKSEEFNEVLALGYFENQKISYHDDGETGLGPTIATLSLGDTGTMRIRMKARHFNGVSKGAGVYDTSTPLPGCTAFEQRTALLPTLRALEASDKKAYTQRLKQIPKELGLKNTGNAKDAITMTLGHGDIVIMNGAELQKYYEHSVDHAGKLRFALTCRYIDPHSLKPEDQPEYGVAPDEGAYDGAKLPLPGSRSGSGSEMVM